MSWKARVIRWGAPVAALALATSVGSGVAAAGPFDGILGKGLKVAGIGFLVKQFGPGINRAINKVLLQHGVKYKGKTKVVPIISVGSGAQIGAAQVQGEATRVKKVRYVGQLELRLGRFRGKSLIPVHSITPGKKGSFQRVTGTGVTAIIDFRI